MKKLLANPLIKAIIVVIIVSLLLLPSCKTYTSPTIPSSLLLLVPQRADMVAKIEIQQILSDGDLAYLFQRWSEKTSGVPRTMDELLDLIKSETGVDPRDFTEAVVFANTSELSDFIGASEYPGVPYCGGLLRGSFSEESLVQAIQLKTHTKFETYNYKGSKVYTFTEKGAILFSFTFIDNQLIVVGSASAVEDTIDVLVGDKQPISGAVYM